MSAFYGPPLSTPGVDVPTPLGMRRAMAAFPTGIVLVAAIVDGVPTGMLANSFTSVSLEPPLVSLSMARSSNSWPVLMRAPHWGISILADDQEAAFAQLSRRTAERFAGVDWFSRDDGSVLLTGASATFSVSRTTEIEAGDHLLYLLEVIALHREMARVSLVFHDSRPVRLAQEGLLNFQEDSTMRGLV